jgi:ATP-dependent DNA helicase RecG
LLSETNLLDNREMQIIDNTMTKEKSSQKILEFMKQNANITTNELANLLGISRRAVAKQIAFLKEDGKIHRIGPDKGGFWEVL